MTTAHRARLRAVPTPDSSAQIASAIDRLLATVGDENAQIESRRQVDFKDFNARKSQSLLELMRLAPMIESARDNVRVREKLASVVTALDRNERALALQIRAAKAVSDLIARAVIEGQSDGTYDERSWKCDGE
jgi:hypothetical protein